MFYSSLFGRLHGAFKNFSGRSAFARAFILNLEHGATRNEDVLDPDNILIYAARSLKEYKRGTFNSDNFLTKQINHFIDNVENNRGAKTRNYHQWLADLGAIALKFEFPIQKVPMNIYAEGVLDYTLGFFIAAGEHIKQTGIAYKDARLDSPDFQSAWKKVGAKIAELPPEEADFIGRNYRKGGFGLMVGALAVGGYITIDKDKNYSFFGVKMPKWFSKVIPHMPIMMPATIIGNVERVHDENKGKDLSTWNKSVKYTGAALKPLKEENPYLNIFDSKYQAASAVPFPPPVVGDIRSLSDDNVYKPQNPYDVWRLRGGIDRKDVPYNKR
jgi:hypothetical protein